MSQNAATSFLFVVSVRREVVLALFIRLVLIEFY